MGVSGPSLLIESTDSMIRGGWAHGKALTYADNLLQVEGDIYIQVKVYRHNSGAISGEKN